MVSQTIRRAAAKIIGERPFGACQFIRHALRGELSEDSAFNGQPGRQKLFIDLIRVIRFDEVVETGTFRGDTTAFMARQSGLQVFTCESSPRHFGYSHARFALDRNVHVAFSDSRQFLSAHFGMREHAEGTVFAYLDAHWGTDLPLFEETRMLLALPPNIVVMIDDFQVPDDPGYAFDSYGPAATLNLEYLRLRESPEVRIFFPAMRSSGEAGFRRGCVVLAKNGPIADRLQSMDSLRPWKLQ